MLNMCYLAEVAKECVYSHVSVQLLTHRYSVWVKMSWSLLETGLLGDLRLLGWQLEVGLNNVQHPKQCVMPARWQLNPIPAGRCASYSKAWIFPALFFPLSYCQGHPVSCNEIWTGFTLEKLLLHTNQRRQEEHLIKLVNSKWGPWQSLMLGGPPLLLSIFLHRFCFEIGQNKAVRQSEE